jgi:hypothetical protein
VKGQTRDRALVAAIVVGLTALVWRIVLVRLYWGHEEEDWGNLEIVRGVLDTRFTYVETEHMPLFAWLAALITRVVGDVHLGCLVITVGCGAIAVALVTWIGTRWLSPAAGLIAGLAMCFQPESALYSASPLRESLYVALMLAGIVLVGRRYLAWGATVLSVAFLARFNVAFSILPALVLWALLPRDEPLGRRVWIAAAAIAAVVLAWALYYHHDTGHWAFWGRVVEVNTGGAVADLYPRERIAAMVWAVGGLFVLVLPDHVGWIVLPLAIVGGVALHRGLARRPDAGRWLLLCALGTVGLLATTALVSTYEPGHNLYWKWLTPSVPFLLLLGAHGAVLALARLPRGAVVALGVAALGLTGFNYAAETRAQIQLSEQLYGTQVRLVRWVEHDWEPGVAVLADGIAASWLRGRRSGVRVVSWEDVGLPQDDPQAFGAWLQRQRIGLVMWFSEEWFGAMDAAGYLEGGEEQTIGPTRLLPLVREDGYGLIAYQAVADGIPRPLGPPPDALTREREP